MLTVDESSNNNTDDSSGPVTIKVLLTCTGTESLENVTLSISVPDSITTDDISIVVPSIGNMRID
jgi:hypothetical protein